MSFKLWCCCLNRRLFISALLMVVMAVPLQWKRSSYYKNSRHSIFWTELHTAKSTIRELTTFFHLLFSFFFLFCFCSFFFLWNHNFIFSHYCDGSFNKTFTNSTAFFLLWTSDQLTKRNMQEFHSTKPLIWMLMDTARCLQWFLKKVLLS